jgi:hypothetical protein
VSTGKLLEKRARDRETDLGQKDGAEISEKFEEKDRSFFCRFRLEPSFLQGDKLDPVPGQIYPLDRTQRAKAQERAEFRFVVLDALAKSRCVAVTGTSLRTGPKPAACNRSARSFW